MIRMNVVGTKVKVNTTAIQGLFNETGSVGRHAKRVGREIKYLAIAEAPIRTGDLKASHTGPHFSPSTLGNHITVGNTSNHALYVHEGTTGPIRPHNPTGFLWVRPRPHSWYSPDPDWPGGRTPVPSVRGQRANPWLADAMRLVVKLNSI